MMLARYSSAMRLWSVVSSQLRTVAAVRQVGSLGLPGRHDDDISGGIHDVPVASDLM